MHGCGNDCHGRPVVPAVYNTCDLSLYERTCRLEYEMTKLSKEVSSFTDWTKEQIAEIIQQMIDSGQLDDIFADHQNVYVSKLKITNPGLTSAQYIDLAIATAKSMGEYAKIYWDGSDFTVTATETHNLTGTGGIDFNGATITMPVGKGYFLQYYADDAIYSMEVPYDQFAFLQTGYGALFGKIFTYNTSNSGNATMCLGDRMSATGATGEVIYSHTTLVTNESGYYTNGQMTWLPQSGKLTVYNVHSYPAIKGTVGNAHFVYPAASNVYQVLDCSRSNVLLHDVTVTGQTTTSGYHSPIFHFLRCYNIEVYNLFAPNIFDGSKSTGSVLGFQDGNSDIYIHDCNLYNNHAFSWGSISASGVTNFTVERCSLNRFDCHYNMFGKISVRNCTLNRVDYPVGSGVIEIENNVFVTLNPDVSGWLSFITFRTDVPGYWNGNIVTKNNYVRGLISYLSKMYLWSDYSPYSAPSNRTITSLLTNGTGERTIRDSRLLNVHRIFDVGMGDASDDNRRYLISNCIIKEETTTTTSLVLNNNNKNMMHFTLTIENSEVRFNSIINGGWRNLYLVNCDFGTFNIKWTATRETNPSAWITGCRFYNFDSENTAGSNVTVICTNNFIVNNGVPNLTFNKGYFMGYGNVGSISKTNDNLTAWNTGPLTYN